MWSFWDKDSAYQFYRAPEELIKKYKLTDKEDIRDLSKWLYKAHYNYSNWYIKKDIPYNTFQDLVTRLKQLSLPEAKKVLQKLNDYLLTDKTTKKEKHLIWVIIH